jgi:dihydroorotate dehydrogenase
VTINISSPNTPGLRALQEKNNAMELAQTLVRLRDSLEQKFARRVPLWLKIAPDLNLAEEEDIAEVVVSSGLDALVISNTTVERFELRNINAAEIGGLSGSPLFEKSTAQLSRFYRLTKGKIILIGVGGIDSAESAYTKIKSGASLVSIYSALIYEGFGLVPKIVSGLSDMLRHDGFSNVSEAIGVESA